MNKDERQPAHDGFETNAIRPSRSAVGELVGRALGSDGDPDAFAMLLAAVNMAIKANAPVTASNICFDAIQAVFYSAPDYVGAVAAYSAFFERQVMTLPKHR